MTSPQQLAFRKPVLNPRKYNQGICNNPIQNQESTNVWCPNVAKLWPMIGDNKYGIKGNFTLLFSNRFQIGWDDMKNDLT